MSLIDQLLPAYQFSERHSCRVAADPAMVLDAVAAYRPDGDRFFQFMIGLRELPMRLLAKADSAPEPFGLHNFTLLARTDEAIVYGLIGKFWRLNYGLTPVVSGEAFKAFSENGVAKLALGFSVENAPAGQTRLVTETRVHCPDRVSRLSFTPYWILIRPVSELVPPSDLEVCKGHERGFHIAPSFALTGSSASPYRGGSRCGPWRRRAPSPSRRG